MRAGDFLIWSALMALVLQAAVAGFMLTRVVHHLDRIALAAETCGGAR